MSNRFYFRLLKLYSDTWARRHCRVVMSGEHHLANNQERRRIYIVSHPTTYYFVTFCKPLRYEDYARERMDYQAFRTIACAIESEFQEVQAQLERELADNPQLRDNAGRKRGGSSKQVFL